jgi:hypothetical protein
MFKALFNTIAGFVGVVLVFIALICFIMTAHADESDKPAKDRERVYVQPTGEQIVVTDEICDIPNLSPDNIPLRNAYAFDPVSNRRVEGCSLEYTDLIEVQLWDDVARIHLDLRIPTKNFKSRSKIPEVKTPEVK